MDISRLKIPFLYFKQYLLNPFSAIKSVPSWNIYEIVGFQFGITAILGLLAMLMGQSYLNFIFFPLSSFIITGISAALFFFILSLLYSLDFSFLKIYMIVFLAHLPFLFLRVFKTFAAPVELIGFAATIILLTVGFIENFQLPKKRLITISGFIYVIYFLIWMGFHLHGQKTTFDIKRKLQEETSETQNTIDAIEKELK